eukprot:3019095-Rhodomonas_salina.2
MLSLVHIHAVCAAETLTSTTASGQCLVDPLIRNQNGQLVYTALCDDDCQLLCDKEDPTTPDPACPLKVGLDIFTGLCVEVRMLDGSNKRVCT